MIKPILKYFDKLEDRTRGQLSRTPIFYAFLGGIGVVLFWRGIWHSADDINMPAVVSLILGTIILLITGAFVTTFIGNKLIVSGLYGEKRLAEKTEEEIKSEGDQIEKIQNSLDKVEKELEKIESEIHKA
jgi:membrane-bound ClpP family serine protease